MRVTRKYVQFVEIELGKVAERWKSQYWDAENGWQRTCSAVAETIYEKLVALGRTPKIEDVNQVIGNKSWTTMACEGCGASVNYVVTIGKDGSYSNNYCTACVEEAHDVLTDALREKFWSGMGVSPRLVS